MYGWQAHRPGSGSSAEGRRVVPYGTSRLPKAWTGVPRFHLNLRDGLFVPDCEGQIYEDLDSATLAACKGALELMAADVLTGQLNLSQKVEITDEDGKVCHVLHFRDVLKILDENSA